MRASEIICEIEQRAVSFESVIHIIRSISGTFPPLFSKLEKKAHDYFVNNGTIKGFSASFYGGNDWMSVHFDQLDRNLRYLGKYIQTTDLLRDFLQVVAPREGEEKKNTFKYVSNNMPEILLSVIDLNLESRQVARDRKQQLEGLEQFVQEWIDARSKYHGVLRELKSLEDQDAIPELKAKTPRAEPTVKSQQIATGTQLIDPILKKLPKDIRDQIDINSIRRSGDQLGALMVALRPHMAKLQKIGFQIEENYY